MNQHTQVAMPPMTPLVKGILILSGVVFLLDLSLQAFFHFSLAPLLGFMPARLLEGWIWQPFTYSFLHAGLFHILFNLLVLWTVGSELEMLWGRVSFLSFYFLCALGAAATYGIFSLVGIGPGPMAPVVGSSGVVYGMLLAYGILFGERMMYFFMLFPMPAKYFVLLLGGVELLSSVFYGTDGIAHMAHLGGMVFGFFYLVAMAQWRRRIKLESQGESEARERQKRIRKAGHLKLVDESEEEKPKHWN